MTTTSNSSAQFITEVTRRTIIDTLILGDHVYWWPGRLSELAFLSRLYNLNELASTDYRFSNAAGDIQQHRINNSDWDDDWVFHDTRFGLATGSDETLLKFLAEMLHPVVQPNPDDVAQLLATFNRALAPDGFELFASGEISGKAIYSHRRNDGFHPTKPPALLKKRSLLTDRRVLDDHLKRINRDLASDPSAAIGSCKELVESTLKIILDSANIAYGRGDDLPTLYKSVALHLRLNVEAVPANPKGSHAAQGVLRTLTTTVQRLAELRNELGGGHGRVTPSILETRHARLAFNSTVTVTEFLLDTWDSRGSAPIV